MSPEPDVERLLSGQSGIVLGRRARLRGRLRDLLDDAALLARLAPWRIDRAERRVAAPAAVHVLGVYSSDGAPSMGAAVAELRKSRRALTLALGALDEPAPPLDGATALSGLRGGGKFQNLNLLLRERPPGEAGWLLVVDDDVALPGRFLDRFLFLAEHFRLALAQPALRHTSHAAWRVVRRERGTLARLTRLVEIGPVTAFHRSVLGELTPFPELRMGWGLDLHWGGLGRDRGWRLGVVDAVPIRHEARVTASGYDRQAAVEELRGFLAGDVPHIDREAALTVLHRHRSL
jgi:hypothetical protein